MQPSSDEPAFPSGVKSYMLTSRYKPRDMEVHPSLKFALDALICTNVAGSCKKEDTVRRSLEQDGFCLGKLLLQGVDEVQNLLKDHNDNFKEEANQFFLYEVGVA